MEALNILPSVQFRTTVVKYYWNKTSSSQNYLQSMQQIIKLISHLRCWVWPTVIDAVSRLLSLCNYCAKQQSSLANYQRPAGCRKTKLSHPTASIYFKSLSWKWCIYFLKIPAAFKEKNLQALLCPWSIKKKSVRILTEVVIYADTKCYNFSLW